MIVHTTRSRAASLRGPIVRQTILALPCLALAWLCLANLHLDPSAAVKDLGGFGAGRWLAACAFAALGFWAVGRYDRLVHRHMGTGTPPALASRAGIAAIAISQTTGFGLVVGALVRRHLTPTLDLWSAARLSFLVSISFLGAWAILAAISALVLSPDLPGVQALAAGVLVAALAFVPLVALRPGRLASVLPTLPAAASILPLAAADLLAAAMALVCFMPAAPTPDIIAAFIVAYGIGLVSGVPGGVGPFEATLIALLPHVDPATLLPAIMAYRIVYFALPALLGLILLVRGPQHGEAGTIDTPLTSEEADACLHGRTFAAEAGLARQGEATILSIPGGPRQVTRRGGHSLVHLAFVDRPDPKSGDRLLDGFAVAARESLRIPCLYRIAPDVALIARRRGWSVARTGSEAVIDPTGWTAEIPGRAQLRRKLKKAQKGKVAVSELPVSSASVPAELARIDGAWTKANGGARGFTMGRFSPGYICAQRVFVARIDGEIRAFATFHANRREWVLDLMRHDGVPDGTMHAVVAHAIRAACSEGCTRLSLAAVPEAPLLLPRRMREAIAKRMGTAGLRQFKEAFLPRWEKRYIAAPGPLSLALAWADIAREVTRQPRDNTDIVPAPASRLPRIFTAAVAEPRPAP